MSFSVMREFLLSLLTDLIDWREELSEELHLLRLSLSFRDTPGLAHTFKALNWPFSVAKRLTDRVTRQPEDSDSNSTDRHHIYICVM